jgi:thioredoxin 2
MATENEATIVTCGACGQRNRVAAGRSADEARCGRCKRSLGLATVAAVTDATYAREVEGSGLPVVVDCWAPWCGPCRMVAPVLEDLAAELAGRVKFVKVNTDENPAVAARFSISSIPTLLLVRGGQLSGRVIGAQPKAAILSELRRVGFV